MFLKIRHKIPKDFEIQSDQPIPNRRPNLVLKQEEKANHPLGDFDESATTEWK